MASLQLVKMSGGRILDISIVESQMQGCADVLRYATGAMEASAVDIVPRAGNAALERRLVDEALAEMELADTAYKELAARATTRASVKEEAGSLSEALTAAKARSLVAVAAWEAKSDRWRAAVKAADLLCDKQTEEVGRLVRLFSEACPVPVLEALMPGTRAVGMMAAPDGSVATPGEVLSAVRRVIQGMPTVTIPTALGMYAKLFAPLEGVVSPRAVALWNTMLSGLKALQRDLFAQVGALTAHIVGRWIHDMVREAVGTLGGTGPSLAEILEVGLGDGKKCVDSHAMTFDDLFLLLGNEAVRAKLEWMSTLRVPPGQPGAVVKGARAHKAAGDVTHVEDSLSPVVKSICWKFKDTGTCPYGDSCRFSHEDK